MKFLLRILKWTVAAILFSILILYITGFDYILKGVRVVYFTGHSTAFIDDHVYFDNDTVAAAENPQPWPRHKNYNGVAATEKLRETNRELETVAFLIIKNDSLWFEEYAENYGPRSKTNSFSMAKSMVVAMLGKAIEQGHIKDLNQKVGDFFPQFSESQTTVGDLASMASGLNWEESYSSPFSMTARSYYDENIAKTILNLEVIEKPGKAFKYLSGNTQLLAMVIEKATGQKLATYLSENFWQPMGAEQAALWQVDDAENRLVKAYCCLASNARDFARFGKLYKDFGKWNGKQLLDSSFVEKSVRPRFPESPHYGYGFWLNTYKGKNVFAMRGILGQYVIVVPEDDLIVVRLGHRRGERTEAFFTADFFVYLDETYKMLQNGS